ncbi:MAG: META domain-containing protein [Gloeotrichia echinulata GP01]
MTQGFARITHSFVKSAFCLLLAFGCLLGFSGNAFAASDIDGSWVLRRGPGAETSKVTAKFEQGQLTGNGGCNNYIGSYKITDDNGIKIAIIASTKKSCGEEIDRNERLYFQALQSAEIYRVKSNTLIIIGRNPSTGPLIFSGSVPSSNIEGSWRLNRGPGAETSKVTAKFEQGRLTGNGGCNNYNASYETTNNNRIKISPIASTKMSCGEEIDRNEYLYFQALENAERYSATSNRLLISGVDPSTGPLIFNQDFVPLNSSSSNVDGSWRLNSGLGAETSKVTAKFKQGQLTGNGGCNRYFTSYETTNNIVTAT